VRQEVQLSQVMAAIFVFLISIMIVIIALLYLLKKLRLPGLVFEVAKVKKEFSDGMPILRKS
jgi:hypothetical protein